MKLAHDMYEIRGSVVNLRFVFPHTRRIKNRRKNITSSCFPGRKRPFVLLIPRETPGLKSPAGDFRRGEGAAGARRDAEDA